MNSTIRFALGLGLAVVIGMSLSSTNPVRGLADEPPAAKTADKLADELADKLADKLARKLAEKRTDKLVGTWRLEEAKSPGTPSGIGTRLKLFTGTHWVVTQPDPQTGEVIFHHGGRYTFDGETVKTTTEFAGESTKSRIGVNGTYQIKIDGDTLIQVDADGIYNETWKRLK